jgi:hypothetical protein
MVCLVSISQLLTALSIVFLVFSLNEYEKQNESPLFSAFKLKIKQLDLEEQVESIHLCYITSFNLK